MSDDKPKKPYAKYAFHNLYNYTLLGAAAAVAVVTGTWIPLAVAAGLEGLWMVNAPGSKVLRRLWFDKVHDQKEREAAAARREEAIGRLAVQDIGRVKMLEEKHAQIMKLAEENQSFTTDLLGPELGKLDKLVDGFLSLAESCGRYERYLASVSWDELEHDLRRWQEASEYQEDPQLRRTAKKNLDVLMRRREKLLELSKYTQGARAQMALIENTFRLISDQVLTMQSPQELGGQLDELMDGVEAVRSVAAEREMLMQADG